MKAILVGSGSMWSCRNSACGLLEEHILLDIPNGTCRALRRMGRRPDVVTHLFLTHLHGDHCFDLPFWVLECLKFDLPKEPITVHFAEEGIPYLKRLIREAFPATVSEEKLQRYVRWDPSEAGETEGISFQRFLVDHGNIAPAFGYRFEKDGVSLGFTGDSCLCPGVELLFESCGTVVADGMLPRGNDKHMGADTLESLAKAHPSCRIYATHLNDNTRELLETCPLPNLSPAEDGQELNL